MSSIRDQILSTDDIVQEDMIIPEWGDVKILVRSMTAGERTSMMGAAYNQDSGSMNFGSIYGLIIVKSVYDPDTGTPVFSEDDIPTLNEKNGAVVERIAQTAMRLAGLTTDSLDEAGNDSSGDPTGDTSSTSQSDSGEQSTS